jgi:hypothetical protein
MLVIANQHKMPRAMNGIVGRKAPKNNQKKGIRNSKTRNASTTFICAGYALSLELINSPCLLYKEDP